MASLHKQATSANWFVAYSIYDKTGKLRRVLRSTHTTDKKQAERIRAKLEAAALLARKARRSKRAKLTPKAERAMIERSVREIMSGKPTLR
jgi:erythromycin esterase-like protein